MNPISGLLWTLGALTGVYVVGWSRAERGPGPLQVAVGAVSNFFDTLGIGSFATTTTAFRLWKMVPDQIDPRDAQRRAHAPDGRPGVHLHEAHSGRRPHAVLDDRGRRARGVAGCRRRCAMAEAEDSGRHGLGAAGRRDADADHPDPGSDRQPYSAARRGGARRAGPAARRGHRRQLHARRADDARDRPLRPVHDPRQPARHEPDGGVPDHDGIVRVPDAGRQPALHPRAAPTACRTRWASRSAASPACSSPPSSSSR